MIKTTKKNSNTISDNDISFIDKKNMELLSLTSE